MSGSHQTLWATVALGWLDASLRRVSPDEALRAIARAVETELGVTCVVSDGRGEVLAASSAASSSAIRVAVDLDDSLGRARGQVTFGGLVEQADGQRLAAVFSRLVQLRESGSTPHRLRNVLAALLMNAELVESILAEADPAVPLMSHATPEERDAVLHGIRYSADAARELRRVFETLRERD